MGGNRIVCSERRHSYVYVFVWGILPIVLKLLGEENKLKNYISLQPKPFKHLDQFEHILMFILGGVFFLGPETGSTVTVDVSTRLW